VVRVHHRDDDKQLVFGTLDNEPVNDYDGKIELGSELAVSYSRFGSIRNRQSLLNNDPPDNFEGCA